METEEDFEERILNHFNSTFRSIESEYTPQYIEKYIRNAFESIMKDGIKKLLGLKWVDYNKEWVVTSDYERKTVLRNVINNLAEESLEKFVGTINFEGITLTSSEIKGIQKSYKEELISAVDEEARKIAQGKASVIVKSVLDKKNLGKKKAHFLTDEEVLEIARKRNLIP